MISAYHFFSSRSPPFDITAGRGSDSYCVFVPLALPVIGVTTTFRNQTTS